MRTRVASTLKRFRRERRITKSQLAIDLGVSPSAVQFWLGAKRTPSIEVLRRISRLCGVTVDYLVGGS